jgi:hypothetical protein
MAESCRKLAHSIEQLTHVATAQVNDTARLRELIAQQITERSRLEISEIEESRRVKYRAIRAPQQPEPKLELVAPPERSLEQPKEKLDLEGLLRQRQMLVKALRQQAPHSVSIITIVESGKNGFDFAIELQAILESAGWSVGFMTSPFEANQFYGLHVVTDGSDLVAPAARVLSEAFQKSRVAFSETVAECSAHVDPLRLIIGIQSIGLAVASRMSD